MRKGTIGEYVTKAIQHAVYEYCDETKSWCGYIRELPGCWAQGNTIEETRLQLIDVIEGWLILALQFDDVIPQLDGLTVGKATKKRIENALVSASQTASVH